MGANEIRRELKEAQRTRTCQQKANILSGALFKAARQVDRGEIKHGAHGVVTQGEAIIATLRAEDCVSEYRLGYVAGHLSMVGPLAHKGEYWHVADAFAAAAEAIDGAPL